MSGTLQRGTLHLGQVVATHARLQPDALGARDSRRSITFAQWNARACRLANALAGLGLRKGDRVAVLAFNRLEWMEIYVGLAKAGLTAVPVNFRLLAPEIRYIVAHCGARAFIAEDSLIDRVEPVRGELPAVRGGWIRLGDGEAAGWTGYEALLAAASDREPQADVRPLDPWALMYTSGTTGRPKGVELLHDCWVYEAEAIDALGILTSEDKQYLWLPLSHSFGKVLEAMQLHI
ncbi:MAG TPA: AMP-binding protein, partial [Steroidobacteraceae bacterium]|nr:AMP-binding protein [Steroidobacteraceae bacterium]